MAAPVWPVRMPAGASCVPHTARPGQATAEGDHDEGLAVGNLASAVQFVKAEPDRARARVAVAINVDEDLLARQVQLLDGALDDARIGLVADDLADVVHREAGLPEGISSMTSRKRFTANL